MPITSQERRKSVLRAPQERSKSGQERPGGFQNHPESLPSHSEQPPGTVFRFASSPKTYCRKRSFTQHCKNMKIELSCRRELNSEGCEVGKNLAQINQNVYKIDQNHFKIDENRTNKSHKENYSKVCWALVQGVSDHEPGDSARSNILFLRRLSRNE